MEGLAPRNFSVADWLRSGGPIFGLENDEKPAPYGACMAQTNAQKLDAGDLFPEMSLDLVDGTTLMLPSGLSADYTVLLGYRGKW